MSKQPDPLAPRSLYVLKTRGDQYLGYAYTKSDMRLFADQWCAARFRTREGAERAAEKFDFVDPPRLRAEKKGRRK
jgi:hypothetical protein